MEQLIDGKNRSAGLWHGTIWGDELMDGWSDVVVKK